MEEFQDAEDQELPFEEYSENTSVPSQDSLPIIPHTPPPNTDRRVEDAPSLDQKMPNSSGTFVLDSILLVPETSISAEKVSEQRSLTGNPTTSLSESYNIPSPHPLNHVKPILSPTLSQSMSDNSTNFSSESTAVPQSLPDRTSPILLDVSKEVGRTTVNSTAFSSEVHGIPLHLLSVETPTSKENSSTYGTTSNNSTIISPESHCGPASCSSVRLISPTSPEISKEFGSTSDKTTSQPSESKSFPISHSLVDSTTVVSPVISKETTTAAGNSTSVSLEAHSVPPPHQPDGGNSVGLDELWSNNAAAGETKKAKDKKGFEGHQREVGNTRNESKKPDISSGHVKQPTVHRGLVDTTAPFESVKEAVTRFGGIVDWKAHRALALERRKQVQLELENLQEEIPNYKNEAEAAEEAKAEVLEELNITKRRLEDLKMNMEKAQTEEAQAKQDSELAELRAKEIEQGIADEASVAAKVQLEVARQRHESAIIELKYVKKELEHLQKDYVSLLEERDTAIKQAEGAVLASNEIEKIVEDLTLELIAAKESLESAHAAHLEAEEHRIGAALARDQDCLNWENELKQAEGELKNLNEQLLSAKDLKEKLDMASALLHSLNSELAAYMESKLNQETVSDNGELQKTQTELDEVKATIEKAKTEINILRVAESSLKFELEREKAGLANMRQREGMASIAVSSVEAEIERTKEEMKLALANEKEARGKMVELPKLLQQAAQEADNVKSDAQSARDALRKAKEDAEQSKAAASTAEIRLNAAMKEIAAAKASERLAVLAIKALEESEGKELSGGVTIPLEEYYSLSKRAHEVEELSNERVTAAVAHIVGAKESEGKTVERLEEACREMNKKKESLRVAQEKAKRAKEGKLGMEQELRKWRAEHEQRRASNAAQGGIPPRSPTRSFGSQPKSSVNADIVHPGPNAKVYTVESKVENNVPELKGRKKKKSLLPRIVLFLSRKKA